MAVDEDTVVDVDTAVDEGAAVDWLSLDLVDEHDATTSAKLNTALARTMRR